MATTPEFKYAPMFQVGKDDTEYRLLTKEGVSTGDFEGHEILKVSKEALTLLAQQAFHDVEFMLRRSHNEQVAQILTDPEASVNDKYVFPSRSCAMPRRHVRACCLSVRTPAPPSSTARKDSRYGPASRTRRPCRSAYTTHLHRTTYAIRRTPRSICTTR